MRKVLILKPRLDLPFKRFGLEIGGRPLVPIRQYWENFVNTLEQHHKRKGDKVVVVSAPRWQFHHSLVEEYKPDVAYIPHVEKHNFEGGDNCLYYMQTVFPWLFTIDHQGWGGGASFVGGPFDAPDDNGETFEWFRKRMERGESKFEQPEKSHNTFSMGQEQYILCPIQIPHDETLKWHSKVQMAELVEKLCHWSQTSGIPVVFKEHPINPESMKSLKVLANDRCVWLDNTNLHALMEDAKAVYVINSGTGMEAMTHGKPVVRFGDAEYNDAVIKGNINDLDETYRLVTEINQEEMLNTYRKFFNWFVNKVCYNCDDITTFFKL